MCRYQEIRRNSGHGGTQSSVCPSNYFPNSASLCHKARVGGVFQFSDPQGEKFQFLSVVCTLIESPIGVFVPTNFRPPRLLSKTCFKQKFIFFRKNKDGSSWFPVSRAFEGHDLVKATVNEPLRCQAKSARWRSKPWEEIKKTVKVRWLTIGKKI